LWVPNTSLYICYCTVKLLKSVVRNMATFNCMVFHSWFWFFSIILRLLCRFFSTVSELYEFSYNLVQIYPLLLHQKKIQNFNSIHIRLYVLINTYMYFSLYKCIGKYLCILLWIHVLVYKTKIRATTPN
jgi:hypothetical protein